VVANVSTPTRDRIVDAAVRLFGERGYRGTSVAAIEEASGLTPGAGGLYHHFPSKQAVLEAGIERHLARLDALRDIRRLFGGLGDLRAELTMAARYVLAELDGEAVLLRILVTEARQRPELLANAVDKMISSSYAEFAGWLRERATSELTAEQANAIATLGLGALLSSRLTSTVLGVTGFAVDDDVLVTTWVHAIAGLLADPPALPVPDGD
jgi:AcrR family transcriptional regulator